MLKEILRKTKLTKSPREKTHEDVWEVKEVGYTQQAKGFSFYRNCGLFVVGLLGSNYHCKKILKLILALVSYYRANLIFDNSFNTKFPCLQHGVRLIFGDT